MKRHRVHFTLVSAAVLCLFTLFHRTRVMEEHQIINIPNVYEIANMTPFAISKRLTLKRALKLPSGIGDFHPSNGSLNKSVILYAYGRSGSTFVSEFFNRHSEVFYIYEPLQYDSDKILKNGVDNMNRFLGCELKQALKGKKAPWIKTRFCQLTNPGHCPKPQVSKLQKACRNSKLVVTKEVHFGRIRHMEKSLQLGAKVVILWRDPRGRTNSQLMAKGIEAKYQYGFAGWYCRSFLDDLEYIIQTHPGQFTIVRYEDIVLNPVEETLRIYKFLGVPADVAVLKYAQGVTEVHSDVKDKDMDALNTLRKDSKATAEAWRTRMSYDTVFEIQDTCSDFMQVAGYNLVHSQRELKDLKHSLLEPLRFM